METTPPPRRSDQRCQRPASVTATDSRRARQRGERAPDSPPVTSADESYGVTSDAKKSLAAVEQRRRRQQQQQHG